MILSSGVQYSRESIEFRLAMWGYAKKNEYRRQYDSWVGDTLMGILFAIGVGKISEDSRRRYLGSLDNSLTRIGALLSLVGSRPESETERKKKEEEHTSAQAGYVTALAKLGKFGSFDQLEAAIVALNETIKKNQDRQNNGSHTGTATTSD